MCIRDRLQTQESELTHVGGLVSRSEVVRLTTDLDLLRQQRGEDMVVLANKQERVRALESMHAMSLEELEAKRAVVAGLEQAAKENKQSHETLGEEVKRKDRVIKQMESQKGELQEELKRCLEQQETLGSRLDAIQSKHMCYLAGTALLSALASLVLCRSWVKGSH
eukprot:TRINITY_DN55806_c0_g1_i1.p1 TRINITY_DN55806_c0_g1~~TRINITY_DN55806_c0_g1_i1.p1  ORF type:complete len:166 (+),score=51.75 TRINITY_DN55806_c0_g1_i1:188-685(+)